MTRFYGTPGNMYRYNKFGNKVFGIAPSTPEVKSGEYEIKVCVREVYGNILMYPVCPKAIAFAKIAGKKTLTPEVLAEIKALGYAVTTVLTQEA
jgi:hypothetical protein